MTHVRSAQVMFWHGRPCHWCQRIMDIGNRHMTPTRDHVHPLARLPKGTNTRIVWACAACNGLKGDMHPDAWRALMAQVPEWWLLAEKRGPRGVELHFAMIEDGFDMPRNDPRLAGRVA